MVEDRKGGKASKKNGKSETVAVEPVLVAIREREDVREAEWLTDFLAFFRVERLV